MSMPPSTRSIGPLMREIETNDYYLTAIQREFVWPQHEIEAPLHSLLRGYPIGTMLRLKVEGKEEEDLVTGEAVEEDETVIIREAVQA